MLFSGAREKTILFSRKKGQNCIGIDLSGDTLKLAYVHFSSGRMEVVSLLSKTIAGLSDTDVAKIISDSFKTLNVKNPLVVNIIPAHMIITKNIEVPSANPDEIREIVNLQAGRHTPYSRDEIAIDYVVTGVSKHSYTKILLIIAARHILKRQFDILGKTGIKLDKVLLAPEALASSACDLLKVDTENAPAAIAHIDDSFTDFTVVSRGKAIFIRSIPVGIEHLLGEKEKYESRFLEELRRSIASYKNENIDIAPNQLVLTGALEGIQDMPIVLESMLEVPVKSVNYFNNIRMTKEALEYIQSHGEVSYFNIIASLRACDTAKIDLMPAEIKIRKAVEERGRDLLLTGSMVFAILVLACLILTARIYYKNAYLSGMKSKYQSLNDEAGKLERDFTYVSLMKYYLSHRGYALKVLAELYDIIPVDMELSDIRYEADGRLSIRGTAESMPTVFSFIEAMGNSEYFDDVKTRYTRKRKEGTKDVTDFEVTSLLVKGGLGKNAVN